MLPVFTYYVQATGPVRIRRDGPTLYSVGFRWQSGSGSGSFVFEYDVDEVTIPLPAGTWFSIYSLQIMPGACPTISAGHWRVGGSGGRCRVAPVGQARPTAHQPGLDA